ncbi:YecA family protein [Hydrogenophaga laconesensis]|uniref:Ribosomal protein S17E n=1 Tax=Hydrogenophaga laconesensis TaxID=1805971 RepID=A0ABU1V5R6_9BURK|nr:SEC-C metal-binding domain-containing protein [Hydrogenophaga laconesensis]MDR7092799.1 ribosomal protein S17E [Hydrogenophaga laconesensis]
MTFALVVANADQIIQVSDRRLTGWDGSVLTEASGKAGHLLCDDASVLYCFTGLATIRGFNTSTWLMEALQAASKKNARFRELIEHFAELATEDFNSNPDVLSAHVKHRRLTVMLCGYTANAHIVSALISNFQDFVNFIDHPFAQPKFTVYCEQSRTPASDNPTMIQAVGAFNAMTDLDERELRVLLERRVSHSAIRAKAAAIVGDISDRHRSGGTVGKRLNTGRIDYLSPFSAHAGYESDIVEQEMPMLDMVDARTGGTGLLIGQIQLSTDVPVVYPVVHRNAPCPCGSGEKYRFCHRAYRQ